MKPCIKCKKLFDLDEFKSANRGAPRMTCTTCAVFSEEELAARRERNLVEGAAAVAVTLGQWVQLAVRA
jgi:hypothetical protein